MDSHSLHGHLLIFGEYNVDDQLVAKLDIELKACETEEKKPKKEQIDKTTPPNTATRKRRGGVTTESKEGKIKLEGVFNNLYPHDKLL